MSMFYELMMRKKTQYLYPVIKGSLMESPEGVFSGFSASNYLKLDNVLHETEIVVKFTTSSDITSRQFVISSTRLIEISVWDSYIKTWNFQSSQTVSLFSIQANTTYWVKEKITSTTKTFSISTDGINYGNDITLNDNFGSGTNTIKFGTYINNLDYNFSGTIDLNRSYIKIGATKYNLQAVVGYTVVGSPTISDGVVSGFSSANYLTLPSIPANSYNKIEIKTRVTTENSVNVDGGIICVANAYMQGVSLDYGKFIARVNLGSYNALYSGTISANKEYDIICIIDITNANLTLGIKETSQSVYVNNTIQIDTSNLRAILYYIGNGALGEFNGSIDMNETLIKKDNKLWFNGQQA